MTKRAVPKKARIGGSGRAVPKLLPGGLAFQNAHGLFDDRCELFEVGDEGEEVLIGLGGGAEVETGGADGSRGGGDQRLDIDDDRGEALDKGLAERLLGG